MKLKKMSPQKTALTFTLLLSVGSGLSIGTGCGSAPDGAEKQASEIQTGLSLSAGQELVSGVALAPARVPPPVRVAPPVIVAPPVTVAPPVAVAPPVTVAPPVIVAPPVDVAPNPPSFGALPGEFVIRSYLKNTFLTPRDGGHHSVDAVTTAATTIGTTGYEKVKLETVQPRFVTIQTTRGYYVSAAAGGGFGADYDDTQTLQTEATALRDDALFDFDYFSNGFVTMKTIGGYYLTALGGGGKSTRAFHTDATHASTWEYFWVSKCGDLGSGYEYAIRPTGTEFSPTPFLSAVGGGGRTVQAVTAYGSGNEFFKLIQQGDGSYALGTRNGINYVTAVGGGGLAHGTATSDNLHTDATQVLAWERFRIVDQGDCTYTIQTVSGFYLAVGPGPNISTRISDPNAAPSIGYNAKFELIMLGL